MITKDLLSENIIGLLGLESLPEQDKKELLDKMIDLVMKRVILRLMNEMKAEDAQRMSEMENNSEEILAFIAEKVPTFDEILKEEIIKVKQEMLAASEQG